MICSRLLEGQIKTRRSYSFGGRFHLCKAKVDDPAFAKASADKSGAGGIRTLVQTYSP